jgi:hypothetical protein
VGEAPALASEDFGTRLTKQDKLHPAFPRG